MMMRLIVLTAALAWTNCAAPALAQPPAAEPHAAQPSVEYTVSLREAQTQMVDITMSIRGLAAEQTALEICLPVWRPGRYQILDPAGSVTQVRAKSGAGKRLPCEKAEKSTWLVKTAAGEGDDELVIDYRVYCNALGDRTRHADDTHAFLDPATVFMYAPEFRDRPIRIRIDAPDGWQTATGLDWDAADPTTLLAPDYDVLADSPLEIGFHDTIDFTVDGTPFQVITWTGRADPATALGPAYNKQHIADELTKIIRTQRDVFGDFPFRRFAFLLHCAPGISGGTEHLNSAVIQTSPTTFADDASFRRLLSLASHEFFHSWDVKSFRPAGLKTAGGGGYDFQRENYTELLWVAEGTTSYYGPLSLVRAGMTKPDDYLRSLGNAVDGIRNRPGAAVQGLAESSFDAWIKFSRPGPDAVNSTVSFYDKGALVSWLLDLEMRRRTSGRASLDDVMRELYRSFPLGGPGYTTEDLIRACERNSGSSFRAFFSDCVEGTRSLDFEGMIGAAGLEIVNDRGATRRGRGDGDDAEPDETAPKVRAYIGLNLENRDGLAAVSSVLADGPAYKAGVIAGDQIVALNGQRVRAGELDTLLKQVKAGDTVRLSFFRYDQLREVEFKTDGRFEGKWTVRRVKVPTEQQMAIYEAWLGQKWPGKKED